MDPQILAQMLLQKQGLAGVSPVGIPPGVGDQSMFGGTFQPNTPGGQPMGPPLPFADGDGVDIESGLRGGDMNSVIAKLMGRAQGNALGANQNALGKAVLAEFLKKQRKKTRKK